MAATGALIQLCGGGGPVQTGGDKVLVKVCEGGERGLRQPRDQDVAVLVFPDGQVLGARGQQVQNLRRRRVGKRTICRRPSTTVLRQMLVSSQFI
jgi:hypothetical protein